MTSNPIETVASSITVELADGYVVLDVRVKDPDTGKIVKGSGTLSCLTPDQARELAAMLIKEAS